MKILLRLKIIIQKYTAFGFRWKKNFRFFIFLSFFLNFLQLFEYLQLSPAEINTVIMPVIETGKNVQAFFFY